MRTFSLLVLLGVLAGCLPRFGTGKPSPMRVMTYNIQAGIAGLDGVVEVIRGSGADVVALQEVDVRWGERSKFVDEVAYLATQLGMQARFAPIYSLPATDRLTPDRAYGVALLSRYPIVGFTNHALTRMSTVLP